MHFSKQRTRKRCSVWCNAVKLVKSSKICAKYLMQSDFTMPTILRKQIISSRHRKNGSVLNRVARARCVSLLLNPVIFSRNQTNRRFYFYLREKSLWVLVYARIRHYIICFLLCCLTSLDVCFFFIVCVVIYESHFTSVETFKIHTRRYKIVDPFNLSDLM